MHAAYVEFDELVLLCMVTFVIETFLLQRLKASWAAMHTTCYNISRWVKKPLKHLLFLHTQNSFADITSLVSENISPSKYHELNFQNNLLNSSQNLFLLHLITSKKLRQAM